MNSILEFNSDLIIAIDTTIMAIATVVNIFMYWKTVTTMRVTNQLSKRQMTFAYHPVLVMETIPGSTDARPVSILCLRIINHGNGPAFNIKGLIEHPEHKNVSSEFTVEAISKDQFKDINDIKIPYYKDGSIANEWKQTLKTSLEYADVFGEKSCTIYHNGINIFKDSFPK